MDAWWAWLLLLFAFGAPWVIGIGYYWRHRPRDGAIPMSMADQARQRLWTP
jgi:hypothetical protein